MPKRILHVDDSRVVRETARELFESAGFVCDEVEDGDKAIEEASVFHPDLIVLDLAMPHHEWSAGRSPIAADAAFGPDNPIHPVCRKLTGKAGARSWHHVCYVEGSGGIQSGGSSQDTAQLLKVERRLAQFTRVAALGQRSF